MAGVGSFGGFLKADYQQVVIIGPFLDATDGVTPETGIALGTADQAEIIKHGATTVTDISGNTWAALTDCDGYYKLTLTASDLDTEGVLTVVIQDSSECMPVRVNFMVLSDNVFNSLFAASGTDLLDVQLAGCDADVITAAAIADPAIDNATFAADVGSTAYASNIIALAVRKVLDELNLDHLLKVAVASNTDLSTEVADGSILANVLAKDSGDTSDYDPTTDSLEAIRDKLTDIETDTAEIGTAGAGLTDLGGMSTGMKAEVQSEVNDALVALNLDHLMYQAVANTSDLTGEVPDETVLSLLLTKAGDTSDYDASTDSLEGIKDNVTEDLDDIKGTDFVKDTNSLVNIAGTPGVEKNAALNNFMFLMVDSDGDPVEGLTVTCQLSKDGAAFVASTNSVSEVSGGIYKISFTAAEMNYDIITLKFSATGARDRFITLLTN